eukprot:5435281-Amphidinium_carterae.1
MALALLQGSGWAAWCYPCALTCDDWPWRAEQGECCSMPKQPHVVTNYHISIRACFIAGLADFSLALLESRHRADRFQLHSTLAALVLDKSICLFVLFITATNQGFMNGMIDAFLGSTYRLCFVASKGFSFLKERGREGSMHSRTKRQSSHELTTGDIFSAHRNS